MSRYNLSEPDVFTGVVLIDSEQWLNACEQTPRLVKKLYRGDNSHVSTFQEC